MTDTPARIIQQIAAQLGATPRQVESAVGLLDEGATVPFIARYRKEATEGLDDTQLRLLEERLGYLRELEERRATVLESIAGQGKLTETLRNDITAADTKQRLEDLYLPFRPKRRTKAQIAREAGLEPLAEALLQNPDQVPEQTAQGFVNPDKGVAEGKTALEGARQILMERFAENAALLTDLRGGLWDQGLLQARVVEEKRAEGAKFSDYFEFRERLRTLPSHRILALLRGHQDGVLALELLPGERDDAEARCEGIVMHHAGIEVRSRPADAWLAETARWAWKAKIFPKLELELRNQLRDQAGDEAIRVFGHNLKDLLLAAPAGRLPILGLDPGIRTGVKVAAIDATGKVLTSGTIYPHAPRRDWDGSLHTLAKLCRQFEIRLVSIGNGTASRETDRLVSDLIQQHPDLTLQKMVTSEAGASVYSASALASQELPELDVSLRGAVSIARRVQDPLAELVKIEPKSIGVGQYQHDVHQGQLSRALDHVVEDCVNVVGVNLNTASPALLARVSGLNRTLADHIVDFRNQHGPFRTRSGLKAVPRLGEKTFQQAAGFLRIPDGDDPLDGSAVHPEAYPVVRRMLTHLGKTLQELVGNRPLLSQLKPQDFADERFGLPTVSDILVELEKPGRDPRPGFVTARFQEGVETLKDLKIGMILEGSVTNVANFGAFVDIGVHQDGLIHISALADHFVKDPREVVKTGDIVRVKVLSVDLERQRIGLTLRLSDEPEPGTVRQPGGAAARPARKTAPSSFRPPDPPPLRGGLGDALAAALRKGK